MAIARDPEKLSGSLKRIIRRDTIIASHIIFSIAAILDSIYIEDMSSIDRPLIFILTFTFVALGLFRLGKKGSGDKLPLMSLITYQVIATPVLIYLADIRSFWPFFWMIPIFLASFYYGRKVVIWSYVWLGACLILQLIVQQQYIKTTEDYFYVLAEFFVIIAIGTLLTDVLQISNDDREMLLSALEKSELEEKKINSLIYNISDAVVAIDKSGKIEACNPAFMNIVDTHRKPIDKQVDETISLHDRNGNTVLLSDFAKLKNQNVLIKKFGNGDEIILDVSLTTIKSRGKNKGAVFLLRDITKQKTLEEEHNAFVSLMSHELRTPLTIAEGSVSNASLLLDKRGDIEGARTALTFVQAKIAQLMTITNQFTMLIDSDADSAKVDKQYVRIRQFLEHINGVYTDLAMQKNLGFSSTISPGIGETIYTSQKYLDYILRSLLDNALKYTTEGSVALSTEVKDELVRFSVIDSGVGIAKTDQQKIFKPFFQGEDFETRQTDGLGVDLYISKRLAILLGGDLTFKSDVGEGSTFTLSLPLSFSLS